MPSKCLKDALCLWLEQFSSDMSHCRRVVVMQEPLALDGAVARKISKRRFFQDIINSFQGATQLGLKPPQFFLFQKISTNTVARGLQNFG